MNPPYTRIPFAALSPILAALLCTGLSVGCATAKPQYGDGDDFGKEPTAGTLSAREGVYAAQVLVEAGEYTAAIPRLLHVISKDPESDAAIEARYWLGFAYYGTSSYRDALTVFGEYLAGAPNGNHATEANAFLDRIHAEYTEVLITPRELDDRIDAARDVAETDPNDLAKQMDLAELLWRRGDYNAAGSIYKSIVKNYPDMANTPPLNTRMDLLPTGQWLVMTPTEIERRSIEERPLEIVNVNAFRSGEDLFTREKRFYVVTGQAHNRSDSVLYNVRVDVTIYGFGGVVYDTTSVNLNRLNPDERRAFSVRFSNFDNINNIVRHECVGTFGN